MLTPRSRLISIDDGATRPDPVSHPGRSRPVSSVFVLTRIAVRLFTIIQDIAQACRPAASTPPNDPCRTQAKPRLVSSNDNFVPASLVNLPHHNGSLPVLPMEHAGVRGCAKSTGRPAAW